jgi:hypothetical protein
LRDLKHQANDATMGHAQAVSPLSDTIAEAIVQFELNLATAQEKTRHAGDLTANGARGGADLLAVQPFYVTINDADASRRTGDMPLYTLQNLQTGEIRQTTDPGRALITGRWDDIGKFKGPILRGLAARAPYFHNGSAADLDVVLEFYEDRYAIQLTEQERKDLVSFLQAL